jgi:hypothetical protein
MDHYGPNQWKRYETVDEEGRFFVDHKGDYVPWWKDPIKQVFLPIQDA